MFEFSKHWKKDKIEKSAGQEDMFQLLKLIRMLK